mmetsp:Transcript_15027/g.34214  ORF Transcript_15027/g.34214 Transcript_15027/m.34214 type:complete len:944 (-) Transcript_15027:114-2945(-)
MEPSSKIPRSSHTALEVPMDLNKQLLNNLNFSPSDLPTDLAPLWKAVFATVAPTESTGAVQEADEEVEESVTKELQQITSLLKKPGEGGGVGDDVDVSGDDVDGSGDERGGDGGGETKQSGDSAEDIVQFILGTTYKRFPHYAKIFITASGGKGDTAGMEPMEFDGTKHDEHKLQFGRKLKYNPVTKLAVMIVPGQGQKVVEFEVGPPFEKTIINNLINTPALQEITKFLGRTSEKVLSTKQEYGLTIPNIDSSFVSVNYHSENQQHPLLSRKQPDKDFALVVAGESGSGKTFFSSYGVWKGVPRLYLSVAESDISNINRYKELSADECKWYSYFTKGLEQLEDQKGYEKIYQAFQTARFNLRKRRNNWAWRVVTNMIEQLESPGEICLNRWFSGLQKAEWLPRFLLIVDEVGRDLDLAHGLVDVGLRKLQQALVQSGVAQTVGLVLCGTSLDQLRTNGENEQLIGSDPSKSSVVIMKRTNFGVLEHALCSGSASTRIDPEALKKGFYSRVYWSNVRITNRALLPFLRSIYASHENYTQARKDTQIALCSSRVSMLFIPSIYCRLNGLRGMEEEARELLFRSSFAFFFRESIKEIDGIKPKSVASCLKLPVDDAIFKRGIATRSTEHTSDALKFLATRGFASPVSTSDGLEWETLVSNHLHRLLECGDLKVRRIPLQGAWPPAGEGTWNDELSEPHKKDVDTIVSAIKLEQAAVLTQTVNNAQSPDVIALIPTKMGRKRDGSPRSRCYMWELHQSKNYSKWPTASVAFPSIGVDPSDFLLKRDSETKGAFETRKKKMQAKANRSLNGFKKLKEAVKEKFNTMNLGVLKFSEDERVVDVCLFRSHHSGSAFMDQARRKDIHVMTKEFFEPTVSAFSKVMKSDEEVAKLVKANYEDQGDDDPEENELVGDEEDEVDCVDEKEAEAGEDDNDKDKSPVKRQKTSEE